MIYWSIAWERIICNFNNFLSLASRNLLAILLKNIPFKIRNQKVDAGLNILKKPIAADTAFKKCLRFDTCFNYRHVK